MYRNAGELLDPLMRAHASLVEQGDESLANGTLKDVIR